jgi:ABC-2 type transport system permease protein
MGFLTLFRYALRGRLVQIVGWGASLLFLAVYLVLLHDAFVSQQEQYLSLVSAYPPEMMAAFGGTEDLFVPTGFLNFTYFSYVAVILGFMALSAGSGLLAADEERGLLDLLAAYPVSRLALFTARFLAMLCGMALILLLSWLGFILAAPGTGLKVVSILEFALPHLELLAFMLFFAGLALLLSQVLPSRGAATAVAAALLLASYLLKVLVELDDNLVELERFSPLHYFKGGYAIEGLNASWLLGLLGLGLLFTTLAAWRFDRRDLRISGEGSWPNWLQFGRRRKWPA